MSIKKEQNKYFTYYVLNIITLEYLKCNSINVFITYVITLLHKCRLHEQEIKVISIVYQQSYQN